MEQWDPPYCGTLRISNPNTLQSWIDTGKMKKQYDDGWIFNVGCGRFKTEPCTCAQCRNRTRPELTKVFNTFKP